VKSCQTPNFVEYKRFLVKIFEILIFLLFFEKLEDFLLQCRIVPLEYYLENKIRLNEFNKRN
jgi:hypothetical protein